MLGCWHSFYLFCWLRLFRQKLVKYSRQNMVAISRRQHFLSSHSHTVRTFHPISVSNWEFNLSLSAFLSILGRQYSWLEEGQTNLGQLCLCQKQPFTKITVLYLGNTISGHPGRVRTFFRYRNPFENKYFRTISSGLELVLRICDMFMLRISFV